MMEIELLELFSGIGGFAKGIEDAGFKIKKHWFSEIDKHAIANYKYNFKESEYVGSVKDVSGEGINPTIITFGSPCQDFSLAGKKLGMEGERSVLILEAIRIIKQCKPFVFIWENVKGAYSSNEGRDFQAILREFTNIGGYRLEWQLLNTKWVLPQNRERIYLVGHLDGRSEPGVFPFTEANSRITERTANAPIVRAITAGGHSGGHHSGMTLVKQINESKESNGNQPFQQNRIYDSDGILPALNSELGGRNNISVKVTNLQGKEIINTIHSGGRGSMTNKHNWDLVKSVATPNRKEKNQNGSRFKEGNSFTLCAEPHGVQLNKTIRRLTEIECERLQGFPDDWTQYGIYDGEVKKIAKTQRYKLCGNAVTTKIVKMIAERLKISQ